MIKQFIDDQGYRHEAEFDAEGRCVSDKKFDANGNLMGEGIYKDGKFVGSKKYFEHQGYRHEAEYDANDRPVADRKYDDKGNLVGEGIYKDGKFVGEKKNITSHLVLKNLKQR